MREHGGYTRSEPDYKPGETRDTTTKAKRKEIIPSETWKWRTEVLVTLESLIHPYTALSLDSLL